MNFHIVKLKKILEQRILKNSQYSLRAFGRDLDIDSSILSSILNEKRDLNLDLASKILDKIELGQKEADLFLRSVKYSHKVLQKMYTDDKLKKEEAVYFPDEEGFKYRLANHSEYFTVIALIRLKGFQNNVNWIAGKLDLDPDYVQTIMDDLVLNKVLKVDDSGEYFFEHTLIRIGDPTGGEINTLSYQRNLECALDKLKKYDTKKSKFSSMTFPVEPKNIRRAHELISEFVQKMRLLLADGEPTEVYKLNVQLVNVSNEE